MALADEVRRPSLARLRREFPTQFFFQGRMSANHVFGIPVCVYCLSRLPLCKRCKTRRQRQPKFLTAGAKQQASRRPVRASAGRFCRRGGGPAAPHRTAGRQARMSLSAGCKQTAPAPRSSWRHVLPFFTPSILGFIYELRLTCEMPFRSSF